MSIFFWVDRHLNPDDVIPGHIGVLFFLACQDLNILELFPAVGKSGDLLKCGNTWTQLTNQYKESG